MIQLHDNETDEALGGITEQQLQFLIEHLEEESSDDQDYYINLDTLDMFEQTGADPSLIGLLRRALGDRNAMEIRWEQM
jgi:processive 1,2-diacylglycerol beta-glucosyltransferase